MKRNTFKAFIWGAGIFGILHLSICLFVEISCRISGFSEIGFIILAMDLPLAIIGSRYFGYLLYNSQIFYLTWFFVGGTLMYMAIGGILGVLLRLTIKGVRGKSV